MSRHRRTITGRPVELARVAPAHYFAIIARAEKRLGSRRGAVRR